MSSSWWSCHRAVEAVCATGIEVVARTSGLKRVENRRPPKLLKEVQVLVNADETSHHAGTFFSLKAKSSLSALAHQYSIPLGQFLLCKTPPLKLESRGKLLTAEQARDLPSEQEDELIKVFVGDDPEPKSLVDVQHSLISVCAGRFWQAFRLYVVCDDSMDAKVVEKLRAEVSDWDAPA